MKAKRVSVIAKGMNPTSKDERAGKIRARADKLMDMDGIKGKFPESKVLAVLEECNGRLGKAHDMLLGNANPSEMVAPEALAAQSGASLPENQKETRARTPRSPAP